MQKPAIFFAAILFCFLVIGVGSLCECDREFNQIYCEELYDAVTIEREIEKCGMQGKVKKVYLANDANVPSLVFDRRFPTVYVETVSRRCDQFIRTEAGGYYEIRRTHNRCIFTLADKKNAQRATVSDQSSLITAVLLIGLFIAFIVAAVIGFVVIRRNRKKYAETGEDEESRGSTDRNRNSSGNYSSRTLDEEGNTVERNELLTPIDNRPSDSIECFVREEKETKREHVFDSNPPRNLSFVPTSSLRGDQPPSDHKHGPDTNQDDENVVENVIDSVRDHRMKGIQTRAQDFKCYFCPRTNDIKTFNLIEGDLFSACVECRNDYRKNRPDKSEKEIFEGLNKNDLADLIRERRRFK